VPSVSPLANIFSGVLGGAGSFLSGSQAAQVQGAFNRAYGVTGTNPSASSTR
jgi:hypothetical protein